MTVMRRERVVMMVMIVVMKMVMVMVVMIVAAGYSYEARRVFPTFCYEIFMDAQAPH